MEKTKILAILKSDKTKYVVGAAVILLALKGLTSPPRRVMTAVDNYLQLPKEIFETEEQLRKTLNSIRDAIPVMDIVTF